MFSVSFRANNPEQPNQQKNSIGLTENGQKVLNKTNKYAGLINVLPNEKERNQYVDEVKQNPLMLLAMVNPYAGAYYTYDQYKKGNISKEDAIRVVAYNSITNKVSNA